MEVANGDIYRPGPADMDVRLAQLASQQDDVFARWQLLDRDWTRHAIAHALRVRGWRTIHEGVYTTSLAPLNRNDSTLKPFLSSGRKSGTRVW